MVFVVILLVLMCVGIYVLVGKNSGWGMPMFLIGIIGAMVLVLAIAFTGEREQEFRRYYVATVEDIETYINGNDSDLNTRITLYNRAKKINKRIKLNKKYSTDYLLKDFYSEEIGDYKLLDTSKLDFNND